MRLLRIQKGAPQMTRAKWFAVGYSCLLAACMGGTSDDGFTVAETVPDPETTLQHTQMSAQIHVRNLQARPPVNAVAIRKVQQAAEAIAHRPIEDNAAGTMVVPSRFAARSTTTDGGLYAFKG